MQRELDNDTDRFSQNLRKEDFRQKMNGGGGEKKKEASRILEYSQARMCVHAPVHTDALTHCTSSLYENPSQSQTQAYI